MRARYLALLIGLILVYAHLSLALVELKTTSILEGTSRQHVQKFLATPSNWPKIVVSSWSVEGSSVDDPLKQTCRIKEVFGLPPILPLTVDWTCEKSTDTTLDVFSQEGVTGIATNCRMLFDIQSKNDDTIVNLTMQYEPTNLLGRLAIPILVVDNAFALKVLLPFQLQSPLKQFQSMMGILYGIAGVAHFYDLVLGDSQILTLSKCPSFHQLPIEGQALALVWCAAGPIALVASRTNGLENAGLIFYGVVEFLCAALVSLSIQTATMEPLMNAVGVQALVAASYAYSSRKQYESIESSD